MALSVEQYQAIFNDVSEGKSLRSALLKIDSGFSQFYDGLKTNKALQEQYAHARQCQAESSFEAILSAVDDVRRGNLEPNAGRVVIDSYKWIAARLKPTVYADKPLLGGGDNSPTEITIKWASKPSEPKQIEGNGAIDV